MSAGTVVIGTVYSYTIEKVLGQGAFGITYLASTSMKGLLGEVTVPVAVKEFFAKDLDSRGEGGTVSSRTEEGIAVKYARSFRRESENLSKMKHPGIIRVLEAFEANGTYYYSMEYLSGGSLDDKVKGVGMSEAEALPLIKRIGSVVAFMHDRKMMHLDLKPKNVMLKDDGTPVVIDFGLSKQYNDEGEPESSSSIGLGTPGYAPIEQANQLAGRAFQSTLDIYALGATLYKMLTGKTPPAAPAILEDGFPAEDLKARGVSENTISAIREAMRPSRKDRPQTIAAFLSLLSSPSTSVQDDVDETVAAKAGAVPTSDDRIPPAELSEKKKPKTLLLALLGGIAVAAIVVSVRLNNHQDEPPGSLKVASTPPGASIWLDDRDTKKTTPDILEDLIPGQHSIRLVLKDYMDFSGMVTITSGMRSELTGILSAGASSLHPSLLEYESPVLLSSTSRNLIRIDKMKDGTFRYASWPAGQAMTDAPALVVRDGEYDDSCAEWVFNNKGYEYHVTVSNVSVIKNGEVIKQWDFIE